MNTLPVAIESNVSYPAKTKRNSRFPWIEVLLNTIPGDSFISVSPYSYMTAKTVAKKLGMAVSVRREGNNFRVFRIH